MVDMLYLLSGATASGKSTISRLVASRIPDLVSFEEDRRPVSATADRFANLDLWIGDALAEEAEGKDVIFGSQAPLGELLASPRATELEGIAPCLLDVQDYERVERWRRRGVDAVWPMTIDHFCWAAFHRLHARDPQFEQRVLVDRDPDLPEWGRWTGWNEEDPRWSVAIRDTTGLEVEETIGSIADWIHAVRRDGAPLRRSDAWWR
jgi:hypothetical protein